MSKYTEAGVTLNGEMLYKKAEEKKEPDKPLEFNISVLNGKVYGGAVVTEKDWHVYHVTKQECKPMRVRQVMAGDMVLTAEIIKAVFNPAGQPSNHTMTSFISAVMELLSK